MDVQNNFIIWPYEKDGRYESYWFENFDMEKWWQYKSDRWDLPIYVSAAYLFLIFSLQTHMKERKPFNLRGSLALWNFGLAVFSIIGFTRVAPEFLSVISEKGGLHKSICVRQGLHEPAAFWSMLFAWSKFLELGDTIFVVLRKQKLIFLHWYHHVITLTVTWQLLPYSEPILRYFGFMNYGVHSIMYPYYCLKALGFKVPRKLAFAITTLQLFQMMVGLAVNVYSVGVLAMGGECAREPYSIKWSIITYATFTYLFAAFFYKTYFTSKRKSSQKQE